MTLNELFAWMDGVRPSAYTAGQKTAWVNDLESGLWAEVFLQPMSLWKARDPEEGDRPLLLDESWRGLYAWYLWAMMDFAAGEHAQYANAMALYNQKLNQLQCWYAEEYAPSLRNTRWTDWVPAAYGAGAESCPLYALPAGWAVLGTECRVTEAFEDGEAVLTIGTAEEPDCLMGFAPASGGACRTLRFLAGDDGLRMLYAHGGGAGAVQVRFLLQPPAGCHAPRENAAPAAHITVVNAGASGTAQDGKDGADGVSCTHAWEGTVLTVTSASGTSSADLKGEPGDPGEIGPQGETGPQGEPGPYYVPSVDASGNLSWTRTEADEPIPILPTVNIKGPQGEQGEPGLGASESQDYPGCYCRTVDGETEWINPPMAVDTEYRTAERWMGQPVYTKLLDGGEASNGKDVSYGTEASVKILRLAGTVGSYAFPYHYGKALDNAWSFYVIDYAGDHCTMQSGSSWSGAQVYVQIWYVKK